MKTPSAYLIKSAHGYLWDFDGEDYRWSADPKHAWKLTQFEKNLTTNRLDGAKIKHEVIEVE
jgi:hypothetical protein